MKSASIVCLCLAAFAAPVPASAEDEDTRSSVYLVFDPETGEFVTSHDPNQALPNMTGLEDSRADAPDSPAPATSRRTEAAGDGPSGGALVVAVGGAIAIAGLGFVLRIRARHNAS